MTIRTISCLMAFFGTLMQASCQTQPEKPAPPYQFPSAFYVEQSLTFRSPQGTQSVNAQLARADGSMTLVLIDPAMQVVLARMHLPKGGRNEIKILAPGLKEQNLPLENIADSIRFLYDSGPVLAEDGEYRVRDPEGRWSYRWTELISADADPSKSSHCVFPKVLKLDFKLAEYSAQIEMLTLECPK